MGSMRLPWRMRLCVGAPNGTRWSKPIDSLSISIRRNSIERGAARVDHVISLAAQCSLTNRLAAIFGIALAGFIPGSDSRTELLWKSHGDIACEDRTGTASIGYDSWLDEGETMMNGGMWGVGNWMGGDGGTSVPIILAFLVVAFVAGFVKGRGK